MFTCKSACKTLKYFNRGSHSSLCDLKFTRELPPSEPLFTVTWHITASFRISPNNLQTPQPCLLRTSPPPLQHLRVSASLLTPRAVPSQPPFSVHLRSQKFCNQTIWSASRRIFFYLSRVDLQSCAHLEGVSLICVCVCVCSKPALYRKRISASNWTPFCGW